MTTPAQELLAIKAEGAQAGGGASSLGAALTSLLMWFLAGMVVLVAVGLAVWRLWLVPAARRRCAPKFLGHFYLYPPGGVTRRANRRKKVTPNNTGRKPDTAYAGAPFNNNNNNNTSGPWDPNNMNSKNGNNGDKDDDDDEVVVQPDASFTHAITPAGAPLVLDCTDLDPVAVGRMVQDNTVQAPVRVFGLHGAASNTKVFVPRGDGLPWDMYGSSEDVEPHTVAVYSLPAESWMCNFCN